MYLLLVFSACAYLHSRKKSTTRRAKRHLKQIYIVLNTSGNNTDRSPTFCVMCMCLPRKSY